MYMHTCYICPPGSTIPNASAGPEPIFVDELSASEMLERLFGNDTELYNASRTTCEALSTDTTTVRYRACMLDSGQMDSVLAGQQLVTYTLTFDTVKGILGAHPTQKRYICMFY
jgi:hypothetical protein